MKKYIETLTLSFLFLLFISNAAFSGLITEASDPELSGSNTIDFESEMIGNYLTLEIAAEITFIPEGGHLRIQDQFAGQYNTSGKYIDNGISLDGFDIITFNFNEPVSAFGFNWGSCDVGSRWHLEAYNSTHDLIEAHTIDDSEIFYGIYSDEEISYAILEYQLIDQEYDLIMIDNFNYVQIPVPSSIWLFSVAIVFFVMKRRCLNPNVA